MISSYQAKYYAQILQQQSVGDNLQSLSQSLLSATVDINPHQVDAALFAFRSPLSKGIILADEVGLGKTIEAGLILCQYWAAGKRKLIVVCPAALRKQWSYELQDKFGMPSEILDSKNYNAVLSCGKQPFASKSVIICSYNFAAKHNVEICALGFDLAVIDEAHKLGNVYKKGSKIAHSIRDAFHDTKKILLTATPFQNSLMELYGLTSVIDDDIFGDAATFRATYMRDDDLTELKERLSLFYKRTLRQDVKEYINYTKRLPLTQEFSASDSEQKLYDELSEFLRRDDLYAIPARQRMLTTMIIRKIMASSTYAIIGTLETVIKRLKKMLADNQAKQFEISDLLGGTMDDLPDEWEDDEETPAESQAESPFDRKAAQAEIEVLQSFVDAAMGIHNDAKATALLQALHSAFEQVVCNGANRKALIFTEFTRTQDYLKSVLEENGYRGKIVLFNGSNADAQSNEIYNDWVSRNESTGRVSGIKAADRRMAIVEYFYDTAEILIATEAAAEGLNLQFCSLVVNYDLPWNPQRIEQRIGRCHRYGQKNDVVVVNFVNRRNYADQRVYELLEQKFHLFNDVFGASDEILGQTDGVNFEKRIWAIYQQCRTNEEINAAFAQLQKDMQPEIDARMTDVRQSVLNNFDINVQEHLRMAKQQAGAFLNRYQYVFWELTKYVIGNAAIFDDDTHVFHLVRSIAGCKPHRYALLSNKEGAEPYRLSHPLAQYVLAQAMKLQPHEHGVTFLPDQTGLNVALPDNLRHVSGYLSLETLSVKAFEEEQHSLFTAWKMDGTFLTQEECERIFLLAGTDWKGTATIPDAVYTKMRSNEEQHRTSMLNQIDSRNLQFFKEEEDQIFLWERNVVDALEHELDTVKRQIREAERDARNAENMQDKLDATKRIEALERQKRKKRNELADREDEAADHRKQMIAELDKRRIRQTSVKNDFVIRWEIK